jgi:hypothetical protein
MVRKIQETKENKALVQLLFSLNSFHCWLVFGPHVKHSTQVPACLGMTGGFHKQLF